ncbi:hypothetical protein EAO70_34695 [Streptomyces sp. adm13(2018)]|nr:hypothetical protein EAO70_34695 [Streptomyces sp. adm13(2018)]
MLALKTLGKRYEDAGDAAGAERLWERAAEEGLLEAIPEMVARRRAAGDRAGAERLWRSAADVGDLEALSELGRLRGRAVDPAVMEGIRRFGLEADGSPAPPW